MQGAGVQARTAEHLLYSFCDAEVSNGENVFIKHPARVRFATEKPTAAMRSDANRMPVYGLTHEIITASINEGFDMNFAETCPPLISVTLRKSSPTLLKLVKECCSNQYVGCVGHKDNEYVKLYFCFLFDSLFVSLATLISYIADEIISEETEVRLENLI